MSCLEEHCVNICRERNPCTGNLECSVIDQSNGKRTVACSCPEGQVATSSNYCEAGTMYFILNWFQTFNSVLFPVQVTSQCRVHADCRDDTMVCEEGSCQNACRYKDCGTNAICTAQNHKANCKCISGYFGNPNIACNPCKDVNLYEKKP